MVEAAQLGERDDFPDFRSVDRARRPPRYLDEFVYRFGRRWREGELFGFVPRRAACDEPLPYHRLVVEPS